MTLASILAIMLASATSAGIALAEPTAEAPEKLEIESIVRKLVETDADSEKAAARAAMARCGSRKFETSAESTVDGKKRRTRIQLCSTTGESSADWAATLESALAKIEANDRLPVEARSKIAADLKVEIARVRSTQ